METKHLFSEILDIVSPLIAMVEIKSYDYSTPCTEWDLKHLLNHMVYELAWVPDMLAGKTVKQVGGKYDGDLIGDAAQAKWQKAATAANQAVQAVKLDKTVHLSYDDVSAEYYINELACDMLIHGWDVAQSLKSSLLMPETVALTVYEITLPKAKDMAASASFGKPVKVPSSATLRTKLLAIYGRHEPETV